MSATRKQRRIYKGEEKEKAFEQHTEHTYTYAVSNFIIYHIYILFSK